MTYARNPTRERERECVSRKRTGLLPSVTGFGCDTRGCVKQASWTLNLILFKLNLV